MRRCRATRGVRQLRPGVAGGVGGLAVGSARREQKQQRERLLAQRARKAGRAPPWQPESAMRAFAEASIGCAPRVAYIGDRLGARDRDSADSGDFPDTPREYPDPPDFFPDPWQKFPVRLLRELTLEIRRIPGFSDAQNTLQALKIAQFPVFSLIAGNSDLETGSLWTAPSANQSGCLRGLRSRR